MLISENNQIENPVQFLITGEIQTTVLPSISLFNQADPIIQGILSGNLTIGPQATLLGQDVATASVDLRVMNDSDIAVQSNASITNLTGSALRSSRADADPSDETAGVSLTVLNEGSIYGAKNTVFLKQINVDIHNLGTVTSDSTAGAAIFADESLLNLSNFGTVQGVQGAAGVVVKSAHAEIENSGTIVGETGIESKAAGSQIKNYGLISTNEENGNAIVLGGDSTILNNSGDISGTTLIVKNRGDINASPIISNSGVMRSEDLYGVVIRSQERASIFNTGDIISSSPFSNSTAIEGRFSLINDGSIYGGLWSTGGLTVVNSGQINGRVSQLEGDANIVNTGFIESIVLSDGNDFVDGRHGHIDSLLVMNAGDDTLHADQEHLTVFGGQGFDTAYLYSSEIELRGFDEIFLVGQSAGSYVGADTKETIYGNEVSNHIQSSGGQDSVYGFGGQDSIDGGVGADEISGGSGHDYLNGANGFDVISGGIGHDTVLGERGSDTLSGNAGDDFVDGGKGNDFLMGNAGDDTLAGSQGSDQLHGGLGADLFVFSAGDDIDTILDFGITDTLHLDNSLLSKGSDLSLYASTTSDGSLIFSFDSGDALTFVGVQGLSTIDSQIEVF